MSYTTCLVGLNMKHNRPGSIVLRSLMFRSVIITNLMPDFCSRDVIALW